ncbi:MAG: DUF2069 domain-containing protein [Rubrivivax sp.]|nr:DUF2069 domain-containing protein [Rubrivivax sp.]
MPGHDASAAPDPQRQPDAVVRAARALALAGLLGLIALGLAWELWLAPTGSGTLAIKVLPLALCVLGLLRHRMHTFRWLSLLVWLYFMEGVVRATTEQGWSRILAVTEIALCLLLFAASTLYIRWRLRNAAPAAA